MRSQSSVAAVILSSVFTLAVRAEVFTLPDITRAANAPEIAEHFDFVPKDGWSGSPPDIIKGEDSLYLKFTVSWTAAADIGKFRVSFNAKDDGMAGRLAAQFENGGLSMWTNNPPGDPDGSGPATNAPAMEPLDTTATTSLTFVLKVDQNKALANLGSRPDCWYGDVGRQDDACAFLHINPNLDAPEGGQTTNWATWRSGNFEYEGVMFRTDTAGVALHFSNIALYTGDDTPFGEGGGTAASTAAVINPDYASWRTARYPEIGEPGADDDGDGHSNGFEHLFGLNPKDPKSSNPYVGLFDTRTNTFRYFRRSAKLTGKNFIIEYSTDGEDWREDKAALQKAVSVANEVETVAVRIDPALLKEPNLFVRVTAMPADGNQP